ncbi:hypothetical protein FKW50_14835 [Acetobacter pomorum]|uniref:hypothetical protein n=1 Tax=Acetobacter pomorum TaxID=65959 RepID=UPI001272405D|nr:hypothetical protein [Acetobacter pomorum]KAA8420757.1 hypothetical protein FKW54_13780 [Acetobacter pomorum]KAA8430812.1 hypothetical protein FKW50_14835 [Acetobacter pomorum]KAA8449112.1 hypothetical protein FKW52_12535 [Acetobacter pomorum]
MSDETIPCQRDPQLGSKIDEFAEILKTQSHKLNPFGLSETEFYDSGIFEGSIQRVRGQISASMGEKKIFVKHVLNYMQDNKYIQDWIEAGGSNRHDYSVTLNNGKIAAIELKGCLDGNNTNISARPPHAHEFIVWSVCQNKGADPRHNVWSGIHTRFSADIISEQKRVDGLVVWDWLCGTTARKCPKIEQYGREITEIGPYKLPPPCIYLFPETIPSPRNNPNPRPHNIEGVGILDAMNRCFGGSNNELNYVHFDAAMNGVELVRTTTIDRNGIVVKKSKPTPIRRS